MIDHQVDVARLRLNAITKSQLLEILSERINARQQTFVITPYSEFLFHALRDPDAEELFNSADLAVADGIGILWADYFLRQPFSVQNYYLKIIQAWWQVVYTGASILISPKKLYQTFPEKIVGADLFWDLAELAVKQDFSIFLLGSLGDTSERVKVILEKKYPGIRIVGTSNKDPDDKSLLSDIAAAKPDMLFVTFPAVRQEQWIAENLKSLPVGMAIGLGGTFDYVSGNQPTPPRWMRKIGLEWLFRLITQPHRLRRILNAVPGLILSMVRYKVFMSMPYRQNVVAVVVNDRNEVLLAKRNPGFKPHGRPIEKFADYWQFSQGGVDQNESITTAAQRELFEETGISNVELLGISQSINRYTWGNTRRQLVFNHLKFKGQEQHTVYFRYHGDLSKITVDQREFVDFKWVPVSEFVPQLASERQAHGMVIQNELRELLEKQGKN